MAKTIKYQLATERPYEVVVEVPLLDEDGNQVTTEVITPVTEEIVTPVTEEIIMPVFDENGEPVYDENGELVTETVVRPVYDENGEPATEITYVPVYDENGKPVVEITYEPVFVEETRQEVEIILNDVAIKCNTEASFQANLPVAEREAYNGEYTVEDDGVPEPVPEESTEDILDALLGVTE